MITTNRDWLIIIIGFLFTLFSSLLSAVVAIWVSKKIDAIQASRQRREALFKSLMSTRSDSNNRSHVEALNMIDFEFHDKEFDEVQKKWKIYFDHLNVDNDRAANEEWKLKRQDLLNDLLYSMSHALGYNNKDIIDIKRGIYYPQWIINEKIFMQNLNEALYDYFISNKESHQSLNEIKTSLHSISYCINSIYKKMNKISDDSENKDLK